jgi:hypothetical protein
MGKQLVNFITCGCIEVNIKNQIKSDLSLYYKISLDLGIMCSSQ